MNSLEVRAPFLDASLVEFAFSKIPSVWKCDGRETRRLERRLAREWLPSALDIDRKQGFSVPLDAWFREAGPEAVRGRLATARRDGSHDGRGADRGSHGRSGVRGGCTQLEAWQNEVALGAAA